MTTEYQVLVLPINDNLVSELKKVTEDGWAPVPGTFPMAVYNLQRDQSPTVDIRVDESLITIIPGNGQV